MAAIQRRRTILRTAGGFTLIEVAVVLVLMALMALLVLPSVKGLRISRLKHETRRLAGRANFLYEQAAANKVVLRLIFNLDQQSYSVSRMDPHSSNPLFLPDLENGAAPVILPRDVRIRDVTVEGKGTFTKGTVSCDFYPEGYVDATVVHMLDRGGAIFTLTFQPLTGRVKIAAGDLSAKAAQINS